MPGTTVCMGFPYPLGPDRLDFAGDMRRLAESIDAKVCGFQTLLDAKVDVVGDTMTGQLRVAYTGDASLVDNTGIIQLGVSGSVNVGIDSNELQARSGGAAQPFTINGEGGLVNIGSGGLNNAGTLTVAGATTINDNATVVGKLTVNSSATTSEVAKFQGTSGGGYIAFYEGATRRGYVGHYPDGSTTLKADTGYLYVQSSATGHLYLDNGSGYTLFRQGTTERARFDGQYFILGKPSPSTDNEPGCTLSGTGWQLNTNDALNTPPLACNKVGAGNANGTDFMHFRRGNTSVGSISSQAAGSTSFNTSSDYRLKNEVGPILTPVDRIGQLRPIRFEWKAEPGLVVEGFLAHEVDAVVPEAVSGEKDAVVTVVEEGSGQAEGDIIPQQLDPSKLVPLIVAAVQELTQRVVALEV